MEIDNVKIKNLIHSIVNSTEDGHLDACVLELLGIDADNTQISEWLAAENIKIEDNHIFDNMNFFSEEDEIALIPLAQLGNKKAMEAIVTKLEPYVRYNFRKYFGSFTNSNISNDDILSDMHTLLIEGIHSYNVYKSRTEGGTFIRYYNKIIRKYRYSLHITASTHTISMFDISSKTLQYVYKVWDTHKNYKLRYNAEPTIEELSLLTGLSESRVKKYLDLAKIETFQYNDITECIYIDSPPDSNEFNDLLMRMQFDKFVATQLNDKEKDLVLFRQQQAERSGRVSTDSMQEYANEHNTTVTSLYSDLSKIRKKYHAYVST